MPDDTIQPELREHLNILKEAYIALLNDQDVLLNWGKPQLEALYATKIGTWLIQRLQAQLRIRALQMKIEKVTSALNRQQPVDVLQIELEVAAALAEAEARIMIDAAKVDAAKQLLSHLDTPERTGEIRKLYRDLAKQLHPDVNNNLTPEQVQLWHQVKEAYENGDLEKLKAMRIVYAETLSQVSAAVDELTEEQLTLQLAVLKEGIKVLQETINNIRAVFPFTIEAKIKDEDWVENETGKLKEELEKLRVYEEELTLKYQQMISLL